MGSNKMFFVVIAAFVVVWTACMVYTYVSSGNGMPFVFALKGDGQLAIKIASTPTPFPEYPTPTLDIQSQPVRADKGLIEYLLGCEMKCP
jgi:hypothetical protein